MDFDMDDGPPFWVVVGCVLGGVVLGVRRGVVLVVGVGVVGPGGAPLPRPCPAPPPLGSPPHTQPLFLMAESLRIVIHRRNHTRGKLAAELPTVVVA